jgi:thiamine-phosphate pyrophosphorylase
LWGRPCGLPPGFCLAYSNSYELSVCEIPRCGLPEGGALIRIQIAAAAPFSEGADFIQVRDHGATARHLLERTRDAMRVALVLVNDRADIALACGAAGVHLRSHGVPPFLIKNLGNLIVTVACHSEDDVTRAEAEGADYAILAPVFSPLSKEDDRLPLGLPRLRRICESHKIKVIALGGITEANARQCEEAGAAGIAGITLFRPERRLSTPE